MAVMVQEAENVWFEGADGRADAGAGGRRDRTDGRSDAISSGESCSCSGRDDVERARHLFFHTLMAVSGVPCRVLADRFLRAVLPRPRVVRSPAASVILLLRLVLSEPTAADRPVFRFLNPHPRPPLVLHFFPLRQDTEVGEDFLSLDELSSAYGPTIHSCACASSAACRIFLNRQLW